MTYLMPQDKLNSHIARVWSTNSHAAAVHALTKVSQVDVQVCVHWFSTTLTENTVRSGIDPWQVLYAKILITMCYCNHNLYSI